MPLVLNNGEQEGLITPGEAIAALEHGYRMWDSDDALRRGSVWHILPTSRADEALMFTSMEGGLRGPGYYALRFQPQVAVMRDPKRYVTYTWKPGYHGGLVLLFSTDTGELLAILNDGFVQHLRVAATAALGARYLAREDSHVLGILGSGGMARTFALTMSEIRPIERVLAWSPNRDHLDAYCAETSQKLDCEVLAADGPEEVCRQSDILCACTNSIGPVVEREWVRPGVHFNNVIVHEFNNIYGCFDAVGLLTRRPAVHLGGFTDAGFAVRRHVACYAAGTPEELAPFPVTEVITDPYPGARWVDCINWETGETYQRGRDEVTYLSNGSYGTYPGDERGNGPQGIQFATVAGQIYENAIATGSIGTELPRELFLQDTYTYSRDLTHQTDNG